MTRKISRCYKLITFVSLVLGITLNLSRTTSMLSLVSYYTSLSNIFCAVIFIWFIYVEFSEEEKNQVYYILKGATVIAISITLLAYHLALSPVGFQMDSINVSPTHKFMANSLVHTVSPLLVITDYLFFTEKGHFKKSYPFIWICVPTAYVLYVYTYAHLGGVFFSVGGSRNFAYFFLDYIQIGINGVMKWITLLALAVIGMSYILITFDNWRGNKK